MESCPCSPAMICSFHSSLNEILKNKTQFTSVPSLILWSFPECTWAEFYHHVLGPQGSLRPRPCPPFWSSPTTHHLTCGAPDMWVFFLNNCLRAFVLAGPPTWNAFLEDCLIFIDLTLCCKEFPLIALSSFIFFSSCLTPWNQLLSSFFFGINHFPQSE